MTTVVLVDSVHAHSLTVTVSKESMRPVSGKATDATIGRTVHGAEVIISMDSVKAQPQSSHQVIVGCMRETWSTIGS